MLAVFERAAAGTSRPSSALEAVRADNGAGGNSAARAAVQDLVAEQVQEGTAALFGDDHERQPGNRAVHKEPEDFIGGGERRPLPGKLQKPADIIACPAHRVRRPISAKR
jgi:hypothetical protein